MNPKQRFEELQILMPGTPVCVLAFLAADNAVTPWESQHEETCRFKEPVQDFFLKFRIDTKEKLQRILNCCGEMGASWLRNRFFYWNQKRVNHEALEFGIAAEATRQLTPDLEGDELADAVNETVGANGTEEDPWQNFDAHRALRVMHCDDVLKMHGKYEGRSMIDCHKLLRALVRKVEIDTRSRSPEELLGLTPPRNQYPNHVFADGRYGDGARMLRRADGSFYKERLFEPMIPEMAGMGRAQMREIIQERLEKNAEKKRQK